MKTKELKPFEQLNHSDELLRLDWFGGVHGNLDEGDNPLIECFFTPIDPPDPSKGRPNPRPRVKDQFIAGIAAGYLPIQFIGKYFRSGKAAPLAQWPIAERITFEVDVSDASSVTECTFPDLHIPKNDFIAYRHTNQASRAGLKLLRGTILGSTSDKIKKFPDSQVVVIHELELIRYYLTVSSFSCKNIFTGAFTNENLTKRVVNTIHEPVTFDAVIRRGRFVYRHGYKEKDAPILGRILFDRSGLALKATQRVHSTILADQINADSRLIGYPRTLFPFTGKTTLTLSGRRVKTSDGFIFLAYRIHSCSSPFPYKSLSYCDEIAQGGAPAPSDAPIAFKDHTALEVGPAHDSDFGVSTSHEQPSAASAQLQFELGQREYPGLQGVSLSKEKLRDSTHRSEKKSVNYLDTLINASTGGGKTGESSAARQSVSERIVTPSPVTPDLETFIKIIRGVGVLHPEWDISTITIGRGFELDGVNFSQFPPVPCRKRKNIMRQFSFMDWIKHEPRRFVCVKVCANEQYFYLFEAQRRLKVPPPPSNSSISPYKEDMPIMLLAKQSHEEILEDDFLPIIERTVENTTWPSEDQLDGYSKHVIHHGKGIQSVDDMSARVAQSIFQRLGQ